jgi:hypothetical protein
MIFRKEAAVGRADVRQSDDDRGGIRNVEVEVKTRGSWCDELYAFGTSSWARGLRMQAARTSCM